MARHLRCDVRGGWYHITTRGVMRREIFDDDCEREHFVDLLGELVSRYGIMLHAYVLMENHYHLLIETPEGNASRALQSLGLGKGARAAEKAGTMPSPPEREVIQRRLATLRNHHWSSYRAYAGYAGAPEWLTRQTLWQRVAIKPEDAPAAYRRGIEEYLKQGMKEDAGTRLTQALAIGSAAFVEKLRQRLTGETGTRTNARSWRRLLPFNAVVRSVEAARDAAWAEMVSQRGDWGRDLALYVGRMHGGMTLQELARQADMNLDTVQTCVLRVRRRLPKDVALRRHLSRVLDGVAREQAESQ